MPPKKRGRPPTSASTTPQRPTKRVRVGETSTIDTRATVTESGRPKRSSVGEPDYSTTRLKAPNAKQADNEASTTPTKKRKRGAARLFGKRKPTVTAKAGAAADASEAAKPKRGRPKTVNATAQATVEKGTVAAPKKAVGRPKKAVGRPKKIIKDIPSTKPAVARGRPPKHVVHHGDEGETEDDVAIADGTTNDVSDEEEDEANASDRQYWLMKAEPESRIENGVDVKFSIDDLMARHGGEAWDGVRSYPARNNMRAMRKGDLAFFYHSNCKTPGIAGVMRVIEEHRVDETAFDPKHPYYDPKSSRENPKWDVVSVDFVSKFPKLVKLTHLRSFAKPGGVLEKMQLLKQGRLSVSAVKPKEWAFILGLAGEEPGRYEDEGADSAGPVEETLVENGVNGADHGEDGKGEDLVNKEAEEDGDEEGEDEHVDGDADEDGAEEGEEGAEDGGAEGDGNEE